MQKAPDLHGGAILTAFGAVIVLWLAGGPLDAMSLPLSLLLPPLVGYEIGAQCAGKAPQGRE